MSSLDDLHNERFGDTPPPLDALRARRAELADIQYRDSDEIAAYVRRLGGRICDLSGPRLDIIVTCLKLPTIEDVRLQTERCYHCGSFPRGNAKCPVCRPPTDQETD